jgi:hypothetical protein
MALKALDQRLANSTQSSTTPSQSQPPRPPPTAAASRSDGPAMPSAQSERKKNSEEIELGDVGEQADS